jgi:hypothetical protein
MITVEVNGNNRTSSSMGYVEGQGTKSASKSILDDLEKEGVA